MYAEGWAQIVTVIGCVVGSDFIKALLEQLTLATSDSQTSDRGALHFPFEVGSYVLASHCGDKREMLCPLFCLGLR